MSKRKSYNSFEEPRHEPKRQRQSLNTPSTSQNSPGKSRSRKKQKDGPPTYGKTIGNFVFFYGSSDIFSQFHPAKFEVDGQEYNCMEQYMHHQKAVTFNDPVRAYQILHTNDPKTQKKLGRQVQNFNPRVWGTKSVEVVAKGSEHKYLQNPKMKKALFDTYPRTLVEAAPRDRLWGIGLGATNPKALDPSQWRGKNLLGQTLTKVRDKLMKDIIECPELGTQQGHPEGSNKVPQEPQEKSKQPSMHKFFKPSLDKGIKTK